MQTDAHRIAALREKCTVEYLHAMTTAPVEAHRSGRHAFLNDAGRNGLEIEGPLLFSAVSTGSSAILFESDCRYRRRTEGVA